MTTIAIDGMNEEEFRRSIESRMRHGLAGKAVEQLRTLLKPFAGPDKILPERFLTVTADDLSFNGWDALIESIRRHDRPGRPITAVSIAFGWPGEEVPQPDPEGRLSPLIETGYYTDDAFPFSQSAREDLLEGYSYHGCTWTGDCEATDTVLWLSGIDDLHGALAALEARLLNSDEPDEDGIRAGSLGACLLSVLLFQAVDARIAKGDLTRPLCVMAGSSGVYPYFDAPVAGFPEEARKAADADDEETTVDAGVPVPRYSSLLVTGIPRARKRAVLVLEETADEEAARIARLRGIAHGEVQAPVPLPEPPLRSDGTIASAPESPLLVKKPAGQSWDFREMLSPYEPEEGLSQAQAEPLELDDDWGEVASPEPEQNWSGGVPSEPEQNWGKPKPLDHEQNWSGDAPPEPEQNWADPQPHEPEQDWGGAEPFEPEQSWADPQPLEPEQDWSSAAPSEPEQDRAEAKSPEPEPDWGLAVPSEQDQNWSNPAPLEPAQNWNDDALPEPEQNWDDPEPLELVLELRDEEPAEPAQAFDREVPQERELDLSDALPPESVEEPTPTLSGSDDAEPARPGFSLLDAFKPDHRQPLFPLPDFHTVEDVEEPNPVVPAVEVAEPEPVAEVVAPQVAEPVEEPELAAPVIAEAVEEPESVAFDVAEVVEVPKQPEPVAEEPALPAWTLDPAWLRDVESRVLPKAPREEPALPPPASVARTESKGLWASVRDWWYGRR